jgi:hypothetical protein
MDSGACASRAHEKRCRPPFPLPLPESIAATPAANSSQDQHVGSQLQRIELVKFSVTALHRKCGRTRKFPFREVSPVTVQTFPPSYDPGPAVLQFARLRSIRTGRAVVLGGYARALQPGLLPACEPELPGKFSGACPPRFSASQPY